MVEGVKASLGAGVIVFCGQHVPLVQVGYGPAKGKWILPGGTIDPSEFPAQAAVRECFEETGLRVRVVGQVAVRTRLLENGGTDVYFVFLAELASTKSEDILIGDIAKEHKFSWPEGEILSARFWTVDEIESSTEVRPVTKAFVKAAFERKGLIHREMTLSANYQYKDQIFGI